jgi:hypothetical protein
MTADVVAAFAAGAGSTLLAIVVVRRVRQARRVPRPAPVRRAVQEPIPPHLPRRVRMQNEPGG